MTKLKNLFATPKRAAITVACMVVAIALISTVTVFAARAYAENTSIGSTNALYYACADAGVDPEAATNVEIEFDREQGQFIYDVEFYAEGTKYDYWVKASDGTIVKKEAKIIYSDTTGAADLTAETTVIAEENTVNDMQESAEETTAAEQETTTAAAEETTVAEQETTTAAAEETTTTTASSQITLAEAKTIALTHAGVAASDATFTKGKLDKENGVTVYDIEFYTSTYEYEYEINATTGAIVKSEKEKKKEESTTKASTTTETTTTASSQITLAEAKTIALNHAGVAAADATFTKGKLDKENGVSVYEIEFYATISDGSYEYLCEYEYEINAKTGAVVKSEMKKEKVTTTSAGGSSSGTVITVDEAKSIAAAHAGYSVSEVTFKKAKLDKDDGLTVYEIEFYVGNVEYEYEINAYTGAILEYEMDIDD